MLAGDRATAAGLLALTAVTGVVLVVDAGLAGVLVTLAFQLCAPGWTVASRMKLGPPSAVWAVSAGIGIAVGVLVSAAMIMADSWQPTAAMAVLIAATALALAVRLG